MTTTPSRFRKKPVVIEAIQWTGEFTPQIHGFIGRDYLGHDPEAGELLIRTLEGRHIASRGDWIIRGVKGEHYPCKPDIFAATYEPVEATEPSGKRQGGPWTRHGHAVKGVTVEGVGRPNVARCGGPGMCRECSVDAERIRREAVNA